MGKNKKKTNLNLVHRKGWKEFPSFTYPQYERGIGYVPKGFVQIVKEAVRNFDYIASGVFDDSEKDFLRLFKKNGYYDASLSCFGPARENLPEWWSCCAKIGQYVYDYIRAKGMFDAYMPYCNVHVIGNDKGNFVIRFYALLSRDTADGRIYYSTTAPVFAFEGREYKVGFSKHAVERICERTAHDIDYIGLDGAFAFFMGIIALEPCILPDGQPAITFFEECGAGFFTEKFTDAIIGARRSGVTYKYRVGYCPMAFFEGFAKAITLLTPGMVGTPERKMLDAAKLDRETSEKLKTSIERAVSMKKLIETEDFSALKWFHENGITQVIEV